MQHKHYRIWLLLMILLSNHASFRCVMLTSADLLVLEDGMFPNHATPEPYNFGAANKQGWFVDDLIGHCWGAKGLEFKV